MALFDEHKRALLDRVYRTGKPNERAFISSKVFAMILGVSVRTIYAWIAEGSIDYCDVSPGGRLLFDRATVEEVLKRTIKGRRLGEPDNQETKKKK